MTPAADLERARSTIAIIGVPFLIVAIVVVMVVPLPPAIVDLLLATNITLSVLILVTAMVVREPLEFSVFPALLLVTTLFRLALNVSTTRLILSKGFAGRIVEAFGDFVVSGNVIIGLVIFVILAIIQFTVVTNGAGRVAEVGARFTLDAMPGKQMAIDADLNAGLITEEQARTRRLNIGREADFYGSMDGASKFVKGDAIAGVVIVTVNFIGGIAVGVLQYGFSVGEAISRYSLLSVGDGLVSQIPALLISVASGVVVTRVASEADHGLGGELWLQLLRNRRVLGISGTVMASLGLLPGLPRVPFLVLAAALALAAIRSPKQIQEIDLTEESVDPESGEPVVDEIFEELRVEPLELQLAPDLFDLVDPAGGSGLLDRVRALRRQMATELGLVVPLVRTRDDTTLPLSTYAIRINGIEAGRGEAPPGHVLVLTDGSDTPVSGRPTVEPVFGLPAAWVSEDSAAYLEGQGLTVIDRGSVIVTHISDLARRHAPELLTRQSVQALVDAAKFDAPAVVSEVGADGTVSLATLQTVLRGLLDEGVPIRDLVTILESVTAASADGCRPDELLVRTREALGPAICAQAAKDGTLQAISLDPMLEQSLLESVQQGEHGPVVSPAPAQTEALLDALERTIADAEATSSPCVVCSPQLRTFMQRLVSPSRPRMSVIAYSELVPSFAINPVGVIRLVADQVV